MSLASELKRPLVNFTTVGGFSTLVALHCLTKQEADPDDRTRQPAVYAYDASTKSE